jgi:ELWxxDGT repeat protein
LASVNDTLFFSADDGVFGIELWKSDGSQDGTMLVKDINTNPYPGPSMTPGSLPEGLTNVNGTLFFAAFDSVWDRELWKSNGIEEGTVLVKDILTGASSNPYELTDMNGTLYFTAGDMDGQRDLWKSDGNEDGTILVKDFTYAWKLTNVNGTLFFWADDGEHGRELWKSDGTENGTVMLKDINPGLEGSSYWPGDITNVDDTIFFIAYNEVHGHELWTSDGTEDGTMLVKDIVLGDGSSHPIYLTDVNGTLFFNANDGVHGDELWKSDGTEDGTVMVKDIIPGEVQSSPEELTNVNGTLFFRADWRLWKSDGSEDGTIMVKDLYPRYLTDVKGTLFFISEDGVHGLELWKSDGTEEGTVLVADIYPGGESAFSYYDSPELTYANGTLFFTAEDGIHGRELWALETVKIVIIDIKPGSSPNSINLRSRGRVPVAVLTTANFDASTIDPVTVLFAGASPLRWVIEDVDLDGDLDLLFHFKTLELNLDVSSSEAMLSGTTFDCIPILGKDTVQIVP